MPSSNVVNNLSAVTLAGRVDVTPALSSICPSVSSGGMVALEPYARNRDLKGEQLLRNRI